MKKFFEQNKVIVGIVAGIGSMLGFAIALTIGLMIAGEPVGAHIRWYGGMFIPLLLVLRHYAKRREQLTVTRTLIVLLFLTFLAFMFLLLSSHQLSFNS